MASCNNLSLRLRTTMVSIHGNICLTWIFFLWNKRKVIYILFLLCNPLFLILAFIQGFFQMNSTDPYFLSTPLPILYKNSDIMVVNIPHEIFATYLFCVCLLLSSSWTEPEPESDSYFLTKRRANRYNSTFAQHLIVIIFNITFPLCSAEFGKLLAQCCTEKLPFYRLACIFSSGPVARWSLVLPLPRGCITYNHTPSSGTTAAYGEGFFPHYNHTLPVLFSTTSPACNALTTESLLANGWCNVLLTGIHWLLNVAAKFKFRGLVNIFFPSKAYKELLPNIIFPKSQCFSTFIYTEELPCNLSLTGSWTSPSAHLLGMGNGGAPNPSIPVVTWQRGWKQPDLLCWPKELPTSGATNAFSPFLTHLKLTNSTASSAQLLSLCRMPSGKRGKWCNSTERLKQK